MIFTDDAVKFSLLSSLRILVWLPQGAELRKNAERSRSAGWPIAEFHTDLSHPHGSFIANTSVMRKGCKGRKFADLLLICTQLISTPPLKTFLDIVRKVQECMKECGAPSNGSLNIC